MSGDQAGNGAAGAAGRGSSMALLRQRRFLPFFITQFLGAFNDNLFKNAMLLLIAFHLSADADTDTLINLSAALFILPFFLFSAVAGQLAERSEKADYMRRIKLLEIGIMLIGAAGFLLASVPVLLLALFLMGTQSALFGPAKYSILPQHLATGELIGGNALVEAGTFLAILLGTLAGGILVAADGADGAGAAARVAPVVVMVAMLGWLASRGIPRAPVSAPELVVNWNLASETRNIIAYVAARRTLFFPIVGISWFWFYGALFLTQLPNYTRTVLGGDSTVATVLLTAFSLGIGVGSFLCEKLCARRIEPGVVPLGALGLTVFAADLALVRPAPAVPATELVGAAAFLLDPGNWRALADMALIALCGGVYIVPLYAMVQARCTDSHRSRAIAGNNVMNALFMVGAALFAIVLLRAGISIPGLFLATAALNALVLIFLCRRLPELALRCVAWLTARLAYRGVGRGFEQIPKRGPALLSCKADAGAKAALLIVWACERPIRIALGADAAAAPAQKLLAKLVARLARADGGPALQAGAIAAALEAGEAVCVIGADRDTLADIARRCRTPPVPVVVAAEGDGRWPRHRVVAGG